MLSRARSTSVPRAPSSSVVAPSCRTTFAHTRARSHSSVRTRVVRSGTPTARIYGHMSEPMLGSSLTHVTMTAVARVLPTRCRSRNTFGCTRGSSPTCVRTKVATRNLHKCLILHGTKRRMRKRMSVGKSSMTKRWKVTLNVVDVPIRASDEQTNEWALFLFYLLLLLLLLHTKQL